MPRSGRKHAHNAFPERTAGPKAALMVVPKKHSRFQITADVENEPDQLLDDADLIRRLLYLASRVREREPFGAQDRILCLKLESSSTRIFGDFICLPGHVFEAIREMARTTRGPRPTDLFVMSAQAAPGVPEAFKHGQNFYLRRVGAAPFEAIAAQMAADEGAARLVRVPLEELWRLSTWAQVQADPLYLTLRAAPVASDAEQNHEGLWMWHADSAAARVPLGEIAQNSVQRDAAAQ